MRLVTRADFDGLVSGVLITMMEEIDSYLFIEPKFMEDGVVEIRQGDVIANLPYHKNCTLWFDHHITNTNAWASLIGYASSEYLALNAETGNPRPETGLPIVVPGKGGFRLAPSAARVVFEYYTSDAWIQSSALSTKIREGLKVLNSDRFTYLLEETDKIDAALLTPEEVLNPEGYVLASMTIDGKFEKDDTGCARGKTKSSLSRKLYPLV